MGGSLTKKPDPKKRRKKKKKRAKGQTLDQLK